MLRLEPLNDPSVSHPSWPQNATLISLWFRGCVSDYNVGYSIHFLSEVSVKTPRSLSRLALVCLVVFSVALSAVPAFAAVARGPVVSGAVVAGRPLAGLSEVEARAAITTATVVPNMDRLHLWVIGYQLHFVANGLVSVDVDAMLAQAYATADTSTPFAIAPIYKVNTPLLRTRLAADTARFNRPARNASRVLRAGRFKVVSAVVGRRTYLTGATALVSKTLLTEAKANGRFQNAVTIPVTRILPKVTNAKLGKAILVDLSQRRVYLYNGAKIEKSYRCAVGMRGYETPRGSFKIVGKKAWPSWHNPGGAWGKNMPSVIGPGVSNPLGTRAIYINASGIRLHGTTKTRSIGTAASHGCMRMLRRDVEDLYKRVNVGMPVVIVQ